MRGVHVVAVTAEAELPMEPDPVLSEQDAPRDRPFNPYRQPKSDDVKAIVADVTHQLQSYEHHSRLRLRRRRPADQETFEAIISAVVCDLIHRALTEPEGWIAITLSKQKLGTKNRYGSPVMSKTLPTVLERLASPGLAFVEIIKGYTAYTQHFGVGKQTTIRAGSKLWRRIRDKQVELGDLKRSSGGEVIILKRSKDDYWDDKTQVDYDDTKTTSAYREEVKAINRWLAEAGISFDEYYCQDRIVDSSARHLKRRFCNGSFKQGGRLFGGFWLNLSKEQRRKGLMINGEPVAALDFGQIAPRILYGLAGTTPPMEDVYLLPGLKDYRAGVKRVFNSILFADKPMRRLPKGTRPLIPKGVGMPTVLKKLTEAHVSVAHHFFTGIGYRLQFTESEILIDVLLAMMEQGLVGLPIHDEVVVPRSSASQVKDIMLDAFHHHTGVDGLVGVEGV